jgi:hypothetical protein
MDRGRGNTVNDFKRIMDVMQSTDNILLAIRADGGHRYRSLIRLSDKELAALTHESERAVRGSVLRLLAAENVIDRWGKTAELDVELQDLEEKIRQARLAAVPPPMPAPAVSFNRTQRRRLSRKQRATARGDA